MGFDYDAQARWCALVWERLTLGTVEQFQLREPGLLREIQFAPVINTDFVSLIASSSVASSFETSQVYTIGAM